MAVCLIGKKRFTSLLMVSLEPPPRSCRSLSFLFCLRHPSIRREGSGVTLTSQPTAVCQDSVPTRNVIPPVLGNTWATCLTSSLISGWKTPGIECCSQGLLTVPQGNEEGAPALPAESKLSFRSPSRPQATGLQGAMICCGLPGHCTALGNTLGHGPKRTTLEMTGDMGANMAPGERF